MVAKYSREMGGSVKVCVAKNSKRMQGGPLAIGIGHCHCNV
jgi:hypothetical protein